MNIFKIAVPCQNDIYTIILDYKAQIVTNEIITHVYAFYYLPQSFMIYHVHCKFDHVVRPIVELLGLR